MNKRILYLYIILTIFFADVYFVLPWLKPITLLNYFLIGLSFYTKPKKINKEVKNLQYLFFFFIAYTFAVDLFQNDSQKAFSTLISLLPLPFLLGIFSKKKNNAKYIYFYAKVYLIYNGIFALLQFLGIYVTAGELLAKIPLIDVDSGFAKEFGNQGLRISGASYSSIGFACTLGVIFILYYYSKNSAFLKPKKRKIYLIVLIIMIIMTQTRSIIFSMIPVIYITNIIVSKKRIKSLVTTSFALLALLGLIFVLLPTIQEAFPRLFLSIEEDGSVIHRIQANVYGVVGTYYESPLIGIPIENAMQAMDIGYNKIGLFLGDRYIDLVTHHNQPAYFFRYYGFIGFIFFILIYRGMFKIALSSNKTEINKKILFAILVFHLMYTLSHNNKITGDIYIWIFMALNMPNTTFNKKHFINEQKN